MSLWTPNHHYGASNQGGVRMWSMDNEPEWWFGVHSDIYKNYSSFDDMMSRNLRWAKAVRAVDPKAMITGPVAAGWSGMLYSRVDMQSGWSTSPWQYWDNPTDQKAHGGLYWVPYYLSQMKQFQDQHGFRLLHARSLGSGLHRARHHPAGQQRQTGCAAVDPPHAPVGGHLLSRHQACHHRIHVARARKHHGRSDAGRYPRHFRARGAGLWNALGTAQAYRPRRLCLQDLPKLRQRGQPVRRDQRFLLQQRSRHAVALCRAALGFRTHRSGSQQNHET